MSMMLISHILIGLLAIACGIAVSAGTFAFILVIGVVPRMIKKNNMGNHIFEIENSIVFGVMVGAIFSVFEWEARFPIPWMAHVMVAIYGLAAGIFVGCIAVALARSEEHTSELQSLV